MEMNEPTITMDDEEYLSWLNKASGIERNLHKRMENFGDFFDDMLFEEDTPPYNLIKCKVKCEDNEEWVEDEAPRPDEMRFFSYNYFKTEVIETHRSYYEHKKQCICISKDAVKDDVTLLHEMIHLHEDVINRLPMHFHDMLFWSLYQDLRTKLDGLDDTIKEHAHILNESRIYQNGGLHDILFLLKSFDLDMRMGYEFGTVFSYGSTADFHKLKLK